MEIWACRGSVISATTVGPLLHEAAWITCRAYIHASIYRIPGDENLEADAASCLTYLLATALLQHLCSTFPYPTPWRLSLIPPTVTPWLHKIMLTKQSPRDCTIQDSAITTLHGSSGTPSMHGCTYPQTSKASVTRYHSYIYSLTRFVQASWPPITSPSKSEAWSNTSASWDKYSWLWGNLTQDSTQ